MSGSFIIATFILHREIEDRQISIQTNPLLHHHILAQSIACPVMGRGGGLYLKGVWLKLEESNLDGLFCQLPHCIGL